MCTYLIHLPTCICLIREVRIKYFYFSGFYDIIKVTSLGGSWWLKFCFGKGSMVEISLKIIGLINLTISSVIFFSTKWRYWRIFQYSITNVDRALIISVQDATNCSYITIQCHLQKWRKTLENNDRQLENVPKTSTIKPVAYYQKFSANNICLAPRTLPGISLRQFSCPASAHQRRTIAPKNCS